MSAIAVSVAKTNAVVFCQQLTSPGHRMDSNTDQSLRMAIEVRRDGSRVRCFTRNANDWADHLPSIVHAAAHLEAHSFLIDGEVVVARDDGRPDFHALRSRHRCPEAVLYAFDLPEHDGADLCDLPLIERKQVPHCSAGSSGKSSVSTSIWQMTARPCSSIFAAPGCWKS